MEEKQDPDIAKLMKRVVRYVVASMFVTALSVGIFVKRTDDARQHNCNVTENALQNYTDFLVGVAGADNTPAEREQLAILGERLNARVSDFFEDCK